MKFGAVCLAVSWLAGLGVAHATDTYDVATQQLSIPSLRIGNATYSNVVVTVGLNGIISGPVGTAPEFPPDFYFPLAKALYLQSVSIGPAVYYNLIVQVSQFDSVGSVTGVATYGGGQLTLPGVSVGSTVYSNVVVAANTGNVAHVGGGLPTAAQNRYASGQLFVPAVTVNGRLFTNVTVNVTPASVVSAGPILQPKKILHSFGAVGDGGTPSTAVVEGSDGLLYGLTTVSPLSATTSGTFYSINPVNQQSTVLYTFGASPTDGTNPVGLMQAGDGYFYGTTYDGGQYGKGTVFRLTPGGQEIVLHSFGGDQNDGAYPESGLIEAKDGYLYGTTSGGGLRGAGTVYRINAVGDVVIIHAFLTGALTDGVGPYGSLIQARDGKFYGTTVAGGRYGFGTVFSVTANATENVVYAFGAVPNDGIAPMVGLCEGNDGTLYGTTSTGGPFGSGGTVFGVTPAGAEVLLYTFQDNGADGLQPMAALISGGDGNFYGTTVGGGAYGDGAIFSISPLGAEAVVYSFGPSGYDGTPPQTSLTAGSDGSFYGTTYAGGLFGSTSAYGGSGTVFQYQLP